MIFEKLFGKKKKDEPKAPEKSEQQGKVLTPEELRAARDKSREDVEAQIDQLKAAINSATDPKRRAKLEELLAEREEQLRK